MENNEMLTVPYVYHREMVTHNRWVIHGLTIAIILVSLFAIIGVVVTNYFWLNEWNEYSFETEEMVTTVDSEGSGIANYTGGDGGVIYGSGNSAQNGSKNDQSGQ